MGTLTAAYQEFESRVGILKSALGAKTQMVAEAIQNHPDRFQITGIERLCPTVTRDMIRVVLNKFRKQGSGHQGRRRSTPCLQPFPRI